MNFEFLSPMLIILSVMGVVIIIGKNFSKIKELEQKEIFLQDVEEQEEREKFFYLYGRALKKVINKENYQQKVTIFWLWLEKTLRKIRIAFLKLDTKIVSTLHNLREKNVEAVEKIKEEEPEIKDSDSGALVKEEVGRVVDSVSTSEPILMDVAFSEKNIFSQDGEVLQTKEILSDDSNNVEHVSDKLLPEDTYHKETIEEQQVRTKKEQEYINALIKDPKDVKSYWKLGVLYSKRRNYEDSLACFRQIVKIDPTYTKAKQKVVELMEKAKTK